ncbi:BgTH12-00128 [Blumeria graminis f. sp. triticale]|uniref:Ribosomal RNA-processing protein 41 n=3 Tax=Blumeria graminis TaxID=34373 RepID=A0A381L373_BLUGR|nr:phosphorolytic exoribonuclease [Blumeria graminis f. sp. tritici 96224]CAD6504620.1 BgTH12-00128 [Blumeria graminis f. sp. triticale]VDB92651.1 Bgt-3771 [Blumeria graminis f. sp. tritici]
MPLDTSTYSLALLRLDGRRWNELRRISAQISTQPSADGSSYLEMGNTKIICTITGPSDGKATTRLASTNVGGVDRADIQVAINIAGFSGVDRKRKAKNDKRLTEMQTIIANAFAESLFTNHYPFSTISINLDILSQDGSILAALINASTLALIDSGIPMRDYISACTAGSTSSYSSNDEAADPILDLNNMEEQELPSLTVATLGASNDVSVLMMETKVQLGRFEGMLAVALDGCKQVRKILDGIVREKGAKILGSNS